ncbi:unnamed protein product [Onchocerca ochengi]|uniref:SCY domain-containing protein n=1 Tax=Onchocerca ochengi TaxID=42157 RepID=A0A182DYK7_ONCOC|nr:unnamed protein product [Onchocerca ochengi]
MAQVRAERYAARLKDARLVAERRQRETENQSQTRFRVQQSRNDNRLAFRCNPADDYSLSPHVLIGTITETRPCCRTLKFNGETKGMCCAVEKIKLPQLEEPPEP